MKKICLFCIYMTVIVLISSACSARISESPQATPTWPESSPIPVVLATDTPQQNGIGNPQLPTTTLPVTWANLNLSGKLVFISATQGSNGNPMLSIQALDLVTGVIATIFQGPEISWIYYVTVAPDEKQLIMSYSAPPQNQNP